MVAATFTNEVKVTAHVVLRWFKCGISSAIAPSTLAFVIAGLQISPSHWSLHCHH